MTKTRLSESQMRDLRDIARGLVRGERANTCESLHRRGLVRGDWMTGYYITPTGNSLLVAYLAARGRR